MMACFIKLFFVTESGDSNAAHDGEVPYAASGEPPIGRVFGN